MTRCLNLEGHGNFRIKVALSLISLKPIRIVNIRHKSLRPGLDENEVLLLKLVDEISNGSLAKINDTGTVVNFSPGTLIGGSFDFDCGTQRGLGYFIEFLLLVAPFCKTALEVRLYGVTNAITDLSVDAITNSWMPIYRKFIGASSSSSLKLEIVKRGVAPDGGGEVLLHTKPSNQIVPIDQPSYGKIYRIRGVAWSCRVNSAYGQKLIAGAKSLLNKFLSDVYITLDHRKGEFAGKSPGFGITLYAESKDGTIYASEAMSEPQAKDAVPVEAEQLGKLAAGRLFDQIYQGGFVDNGAQSLALILMACEGGRNASQLALGNPTEYTVSTLRLIREFLGVIFYFRYKNRQGSHSDNSQTAADGQTDEPDPNSDTHDGVNDKDKDDTPDERDDILVATCFGSGLQNINKSIR